MQYGAGFPDPSQQGGYRMITNGFMRMGRRGIPALEVAEIVLEGLRITHADQVVEGLHIAVGGSELSPERGRFVLGADGSLEPWSDSDD